MDDQYANTTLKLRFGRGDSPPTPDFDDSTNHQRAKHARYYEDDVVYHVCYRTQQGFFFLKPDREKRLNALISGVLAKAKLQYPSVRNYGTKVMSNHAHHALSGSREELSDYVGYVKREISRRWGPVIGVTGVFEQGYKATAVITESGQRRLLKYIAAQGAKEGLVEHPADWPGFNCVDALVSGEPIAGEWFDGTGYGQAQHNANRRKRRGTVNRADFTEQLSLHFDKLPAFRHYTDQEYRALVEDVLNEASEEAKAQHQGKVLGLEAVFNADLFSRSKLPRPPWYEHRTAMVVWDDWRAPEVRAYVDRYWQFQGEFRQASARWLANDLGAPFPNGANRPGLRARDLALAA